MQITCNSDTKNQMFTVTINVTKTFFRSEFIEDEMEVLDKRLLLWLCDLNLSTLL